MRRIDETLVVDAGTAPPPLQRLQQVVEVVVGGDRGQVPLELAQDQKLHRLQEANRFIQRSVGDRAAILRRLSIPPPFPHRRSSTLENYPRILASSLASSQPHRAAHLSGDLNRFLPGHYITPLVRVQDVMVVVERESTDR